MSDYGRREGKTRESRFVLTHPKEDLRIDAQIGDVRAAAPGRSALTLHIAAHRRMTNWLELKLKILVTVPSRDLLCSSSDSGNAATSGD